MSETFSTVANSMSMYGALFKAIQEEQGVEKALEFHATALKPFGDQMAAMYKQELAGKKPNMKVFKKAVIEPMMGSFGFDTEMTVDDKKLTVTVKNCPMYAGYVSAGIDGETISKMCIAGAASEFGRLNEFYPTVFGSVKPKKNAKGICIESFEIK